MPPIMETQQYVLLPPRGLRAEQPNASESLGRFLRTLSSARSGREPAAASAKMPSVGGQVRVLDSLGEVGAKLVEASPEAAAGLRIEQPGLRIVPVVYYQPALAPRPSIRSAPSTLAAAATPAVTLTVVSRKDGKPVAGSTVVAFTNFQARIGAQGETDEKGRVRLSLTGDRIDRVYVYPRKGFWGLLRKGLPLASTKLDLAPLDLAFVDCLRHYYAAPDDHAGGGVRVAVVDTGIAEHPDLRIDGGINAVPGEKPVDYGDNGEGHGTHVAGIIAARGRPPQGVRGLAPGISLRSYRVFGQGSGNASNYAIAKAIEAAVADECDLINLSLGGGSIDPVVQEAIQDARAKGTVVIAAAGNDDRQPVSFPASESLVIAVSAFGRKKLFPPDSTHTDTVGKPFGNPDNAVFIAKFSNLGPEIDLTGPGVGVISTVPGGYAPMDGTSMACPAVTGVAARLLSMSPEVLKMPRGHGRADDVARVVYKAARQMGFGPTFEGHGMVL
jgi:hypothetical protein